MVVRPQTECDHCGEVVPPEHFGLSFSEVGPPNLEQLTSNKPEELLRMADEVEQRAEALQTTLVYSDEANAYRMRAAQEAERPYDFDEEGEVSQVNGEVGALRAEAIRRKDSLKALKRMAKNAEPLVKFGSGALDFCSPAHAIAFLRERYE